MKRDLIIFVKNPVLGKAKTRLAASIGDVAALEVYRQLLAYTKHVVQKLDALKTVWYSSHVEKEDIWTKGGFNKKVQIGDDLGQKMNNAFEATFAQEKSDAVVIIGSDCAELEERHVSEAFDALESNDIVLGPAKDGGYYLLGMRVFVPELFESIDWSTSKVAEQTLYAIKENNLSYLLLDELNDVDTVEDYVQIKHRLPEL